MVELPKPILTGKVSVEEAIGSRRSLRSFRAQPISLGELGQLLWAAQGLTHPHGYRAAPSAGALYPLETYVVVRAVEGLEQGVYKYLPRSHGLKQIKGGDTNPSHELYQAALSQECILRAALNLVFGAVYERTTSKYGERGVRYAHMEAGHAAQNVLLQAEALGLGGVVVGAFRDSMVKKALLMEEEPIYIVAMGRK